MKSTGMQHVTRGTPAVTALKGCALFDPADGRIRHMHRVATLDGAEETPEEEIEARARQIAAECGIEESRLEALRFDPREMEPGQKYRVDPGTKRLIATGPIRGAAPERAA